MVQQIALSVQNPDIAGRAFQGFEQGRETRAQNAAAQYGYAASTGDQNAMASLYAGNPQAGMAIQGENRLQGRYDDSKRIKGLQDIARMGMDILSLPPQAQGAAFDSAKSTIASTYGINPAELAGLTPDKLPQIVSLVQTEAERLIQTLGIQGQKIDLQGGMLRNEGQGLANATARFQADYWRDPTGTGGGGSNIAPVTGGNAVTAPAAYQPMIQNAAAQYGMDPKLIAAQMNQESAFDPNAVSSAGAQGLMQFMPETAKDPGYGIQPLTDPFDPAQSVDRGVAYLSKLNEAFGGKIEYALAAYNWGPGNVQQWIASGADPSRLPAETREYVRKIMANWQASGGQAPDLGEPAAPMGAGGGVGMPTPQPGAPAVTGAPLNAPPAASGGPAVTGTPLPAAAPMPTQNPGLVATQNPAPAAGASSVIDLMDADHKYQTLVKAQMRASRAGDTAGAARIGKQLEARQKELEATSPATKPIDFENENALRTQYKQIAQPLAESVMSFSAMEPLASDDTGGSDVALIFSFFKTIDPTSTVREGEAAEAARTAGLSDQMTQMFERWDRGTKLSPDQRQQLIKAAGRFVEPKRKMLGTLNDQYESFATDYGMKPSRITIYDHVLGDGAAAGGVDPYADADALAGIK